MFTARRLPIAALALLAPFAAIACGDSPKTTTTVAGASTPAIHTAAAPAPTSNAPVTPPVVVTYADGDSAYHAGQYGAAARLFSAYGERHPQNVTAQYMAGLSAWKAGDLKTADAAFDRALALDAHHEKTLLNSARVLLELRRPDEALDRINTVLEVDSASVAARRLQGRVLEQKGDVDGAIDAYQQALMLDENDVWSLNNLGLLYIQQGRPDEALPPLALAVTLRDNAPVFQNNLGIALERTGHYTAAGVAFESALAVDSTYGKASVNLDRVRALREAPGTAPVSVPELAQSFQLQLRMLGDSARIVAPDSATTPAEPVVQQDTVVQR